MLTDKPSPPCGPITAEDFHGDSLTLNWQPPKDDGGEKITNYIVEKKKKGAGRWSKVSSFVNTPSCQVRNLEPGEEYEFRIAAENTHGVSEPLETTEPIKARYPYGESSVDHIVPIEHDT